MLPSDSAKNESNFKFAVSVFVYLFAKITLHKVAGLFGVDAYSSVWYPPIGLNIAFVIIFGWRATPFIFIPSDLLAYFTVNEFSTIIIPIGISLSFLGIFLRKYFDYKVFYSINGVTSFVLTSLIVVTISFFLSAFTFYMVSDLSSGFAVVISFPHWLGDITGALLCTPIFAAVFAYIGKPHGNTADSTWFPFGAKDVVFVLISTVLALAAWLLIQNTMNQPATAFFILILPISIVGFLRGFGAAALSSFTVNLGLVLLASRVVESPNIIDLQIFMLAAGLTGLLLGAVGSVRIEIGRRNAQLTTVIERAPLAVAVLRFEQHPRVIFANDAFNALVDDINRPCFRDNISATYDGDIIVSNNETGRGERILHWTVGRSDDDTCIAFVRDVTEQRRRENSKRHQQRILAIGELAGGIAHEINNLLHPVLNLSLQMGRDLESKPERVRKSLAIIEQSARSSAGLVRQILSMSRKDAEHGSGCDLIQSINDTMSLLRASLPPSFVIHFSAATQTFPASLSATEAAQVFTNLIVNACDATQGAGNLRITVRPSESDAAIVEIEDDGPGVPAEITPHIFVPFFTTKPHGQGTGLGLAMVHDILLNNGCSITLTSASPHGARFVLHIPQSQQENVQ